MSAMPSLSVVVASVNGLPYVARCLEALPTDDPAVEVIVPDWTDAPTRQLIRERWPETTLVSFDEPMAVPELRAAGIARARAPRVAVIEDHCVTPPGWADRMVAAHDRGHAVVGGPVRNGATGRLRDWAAFFCEYSAHMEPMPEGEVDSLVGMNVSYDREALAAIADLLDEGRWETWLHPRLRERGFALYCDPSVVIEHVRDFGFREFASQRYHYARSHAGMRNPELGLLRLVYLAGSPLIVPLMAWRIAAGVLRKRRNRARLAASFPLILVYLAVWAFGEAVGYAAGGGRSLLRVR